MLRNLKLRSTIKLREVDLQQLRARAGELAGQRAALEERTAEAAAALEEITAQSSAEDRSLVEEAIKEIEEECARLERDEEENQEAIRQAEDEIATLGRQLEAAERKAEDPPVAPRAHGGHNQRESEEHSMNRMAGTPSVYRSRYSAQERAFHVAQPEIREFLTRLRGYKGVTRAITGGELTIPEVMLGLLRDNLTRYGKLYAHVTVRPIRGAGRQNVLGVPPEAVWMELKGTLNELNFSIGQVEVDGYLEGGYIPVHNALLEDSDENLFAEVFDLLGKSLGLALDKAILFGTGTKMPVGIYTRLKTTLQPAWWGENQGTFTDLSATHLQKMSSASLSDVKFFQELALKLGVADDAYSDGNLFWAMNKKTLTAIRSRAIGFNAAGALVSLVDNTLPVIGGTVETLSFMPDNLIVGGYGSLYLLAERAGTYIDASEHVKWLENTTCFRAVARYDGKPVLGEGFVACSITDAEPSDATVTFAADTANAG